MAGPSLRIWAPLVGAMLVLAIVAWRLTGATYRADVATICTAEERSGFTLSKDMPALTAWIRARLATAEGNELYASLGDLTMDGRARRLRDEAAALAMASCPIASSYERMADEGRYRAEVQRLCSYVTFPDLELLDDEGRLEALEAWSDTEATDPRTRSLVGSLSNVASGQERAHLLRVAARDIDVFSCDIAKWLEKPPPSDADGLDAAPLDSAPP